MLYSMVVNVKESAHQCYTKDVVVVTGSHGMEEKSTHLRNPRNNHRNLYKSQCLEF